MSANVGMVDRIVRVVLGLALIGFAIEASSDQPRASNGSAGSASSRSSPGSSAVALSIASWDFRPARRGEPRVGDVQAPGREE